MAVVLVTGMSGVGKSSVLVELERRGYRVVDTDYGDWIEDVASEDGRSVERLWREDRIDAVLADCADDDVLFLAGTVANQGRFYARLDAVVLLSAPSEVIQARIDGRSTNDYGKTDEQRRSILHDLETVEPLLRAGATAEVDARAPLGAVVDALEQIGLAARSGRAAPDDR